VDAILDSQIQADSVIVARKVTMNWVPVELAMESALMKPAISAQPLAKQQSIVATSKGLNRLI